MPLHKVLALLPFLSGVLYGAPSMFQCVSSSCTTTTKITMPMTTTAGDLLFVYEQNSANNTNNSAPTDSAGNTYTLILSSWANSGRELSMYYAKNASAITSVSGNWSASSAQACFIACEAKGVDTLTPLDMSTTSANAQSVSTLTSGTTNTNNAPDLMAYGASVGSNQTSWTPSGSYSLTLGVTGSTNARMGVETEIANQVLVSTNATISWSATATVGQSVFAAFKAAAAAVVAPACDMILGNAMLGC